MPFVSTDTAGAVRAAEIGADAMLMAKNIDYIYTADPRKDPNAKKLPEVSCSQILEWGLAAIDATAAAFCRSVGLPVRIFGMNEPMDIFAAVKGEKPGTVVTPD
jgi:uridylate kinase